MVPHSLPADRDVSVVIPTLSPKPAVFERVLAGAVRIGIPVIVVDMSPDDAVVAACRRAGDLVEFHQFSESTGVSQSRNRCAALARTRRLVYLDSDAIPDGDWVSPMLDRLDEPHVAVVGARIFPEWERPPPLLFRCSPLAGILLSLLDLGEESQALPRVIGTSYALDRERVSDPPFDETIGRRPGWELSGEENKMCVDAQKLGYSTVYEPRSVVHHHVGDERMTWRWMWHRAHTAGRERALGGIEEPFPRPAGRRLADAAFKAAIAVPFLLGRMRGARPLPAIR